MQDLSGLAQAYGGRRKKEHLPLIQPCCVSAAGLSACPPARENLLLRYHTIGS